MLQRVAVSGAMLAVLSHAALADTCPTDYRLGQIDHWAKGKVFYQLFVRSFADSDGDGIGDFNGLASRLDYLNDGNPETDGDLGIDAIWMLPITESPSYHGYDTLNYERVEGDYGTDEDFARLVEAAHERGIRIVMDLVVNHSSNWHPWFVQASLSAEDTYHDWYIWREEDPGWTQPWSSNASWHRSDRLPLYYYGLFWGGMPDLNLENPEVRTEMIKVARHWLDRGVDGFRLDAARHIIEAGEEAKAGGSPETHAWWREFGSALRESHPGTLLIGENWTTADQVAEYYGEAPFTELDMSFNFDLANAIVGGVRDGTPGLVEMTLCEVADTYPAHALDGTFLTNHDMIRVATQLGEDPDKLRLAASLLFTLPGVPFVYYGEEIGLPNGPGDEDPEKRTPMAWTDAGGFTTGRPWMVNRRAKPEVNVAGQQADEGSLWNHYQRLIGLRHAHPALGQGDYRSLDVAGGGGNVIAWQRSHDDERVIVAANFGGEAVEELTIALPETGDAALEPLIGEAGASAADGGVAIRRLDGRSLAAWRVR